ncbi:MAG TPA: hypothetical protein V6C57_13715 [Coleofasciculaceae cyanobacterium]
MSANSSQQSLNGVRCLNIEDEAQYFYESSGYQLPTDAQIILSCDDHSGFHWDGEYYIVFDTSNEKVKKYLETSLWNTTWKRGPIPQKISFHTGLSKWENSKFDSSSIWYLADDQNTLIPFHNGRLMVINSEKNRILYSEWDF